MSRCPVCAGALVAIGSRPRTRRTPTGDRQVLVIRRLRCTTCHRIHHELPACLVPYQRYDTESWEAVVEHGRQAAARPGPGRGDPGHLEPRPGQPLHESAVPGAVGGGRRPD